MTGKRKNTNKTEPDDFLRYRGNEMSDRERNVFEKNLQKDPFSEEAAEGYKGFEPEMISEDLASLGNKLKRRTQRSKRMTWYRIAASVAVLMIISSVYIVLEKTGSGNLSEKSFQPDTIDIAGSESIKKELPVAQAPGWRAAEEQRKPSKKSAERMEASEEPSHDEEKLADVAEDQVAENNQLKKEAEKSAFPITAEKNDSFVMAEEQEAKDAYGSKHMAARSVPAGISYSTDYTPAVPVTGKDSFDIYIKNNIRMPRPLISGQDSIVTLTFVVTKEGIPVNIEILSTPGEEYSNEAIRLLKEGPLWKPASRNGVYTRDKAKIEIPFK